MSEEQVTENNNTSKVDTTEWEWINITDLTRNKDKGTTIETPRMVRTDYIYSEGIEEERQGERLIRSTTFKDGKKDGEEKTYFSSTGSLETHSFWVDDVLDGPYKQYYKNQSIEEEGFHAKGQKTGSWKKYDHKGNITDEINEVDDGVMETTRWYENSDQRMFTSKYSHNGFGGKGELLEQTFWFEDGSLVLEVLGNAKEDYIQINYSGDGKVNKERSFKQRPEEKEVTIEEKTFWNNGVLRSDAYHHKDGTIKSLRVYQYDGSLACYLKQVANGNGEYRTIAGDLLVWKMAGTTPSNTGEMTTLPEKGWKIRADVLINHDTYKSLAHGILNEEGPLWTSAANYQNGLRHGNADYKYHDGGGREEVWKEGKMLTYEEYGPKGGMGRMVCYRPPNHREDIIPSDRYNDDGKLIETRRRDGDLFTLDEYHPDTGELLQRSESKLGRKVKKVRPAIHNGSKYVHWRTLEKTLGMLSWDVPLLTELTE